MINLPAAFTERMKQMLGREYDAFIASYDKERSQGLRVNGLKTDPAEFAKTAPFSLNPVAGYEPSSATYFISRPQNGLYYGYLLKIRDMLKRKINHPDKNTQLHYQLLLHNLDNSLKL